MLPRRHPESSATTPFFFFLLASAVGTALPSSALDAPPTGRTIPLTPAHWSATDDSLRFETYLDRPALYIERGTALAKGVELRDGVLQFSMAATPATSFLGASFHAKSPDFSEVIFVRVGQSGTSEAVQYGPAFNNLGAAWQVYHGHGANASATIERERWIPVRLVLAGGTATLYLDGATEPTLVVPRLAGAGGEGLGVWTGLFGRGAYFADFTYTPAPAVAVPSPPPPPAGTLVDWRISPALDAESLTPGTLPNLGAMEWERVRAEPEGFVLLNRHRAAPMASLPFDPATRTIKVDEVMGGRVKGSKVVLARTEIVAERDGVRRMHLGYSDGVIVYANGRPLFFGMNAQFFRGDGIMSKAGDAVYLPLKRGRNDIVLAVTEFTGGWAFWARLDPQ